MNIAFTQNKESQFCLIFLCAYLIGIYLNMNTKSPKSTLQQLQEGRLFFFQFSMFLLRLDFKNFSLGIVSKLSVQVLVLVSTLLPVKVLLFLAPNQPFQGIVAELFESKSQLVIFLCILMIFVMFFSYLFSKLAANISDAKINMIVDMSKVKIDKYNIKKIKNKIDLCMSAISSGLFLVLCLILVFLVYSDLLFIVAVISALSFILLLVAEHGRLPILRTFDKKPNKIFMTISNCIFLISFYFIVYDALVNEVDRSLIEMVIGLVLIRQSSMLIAKLCTSIVQLNLKNKMVLELLKVSE